MSAPGSVQSLHQSYSLHVTVAIPRKGKGRQSTAQQQTIAPASTQLQLAPITSRCIQPAAHFKLQLRATHRHMWCTPSTPCCTCQCTSPLPSTCNSTPTPVLTFIHQAVQLLLRVTPMVTKDTKQRYKLWIVLLACTKWSRCYGRSRADAASLQTHCNMNVPQYFLL